jgi:predicted ATPase/DNA-binding CsgD family transcriptional regulator
MRASRLPQVSADRLFLPIGSGEQQDTVIVGSDAWYSWLASETTRSFAFKNHLGTFTARRERKRNGWYWYVYRKLQGKLHKAYLGKAEEISHERLAAVAEALSRREHNDDRSERATSSPQAKPSRLPTTTSVDNNEPPLSSQSSILAQFEEIGKQDLPVQRSLLIGREQEIARVCSLLQRSDVRLLTLTGTGGIGKTRLGLQVADDLSSNFADGVYFVPLASIRDPELIMPTIAQTLGVKESGGQLHLNLLKAYLRDKQVLLLLDNFEQVLTAAPGISDLLAACSRLKILLTSRAPLHISGEHEFHVPPLLVPDLKHLPTVERLSEYAAVALFLQRARMIKSDFQMSPTNARFIAEICVRLDGLPLAIELAAARSKLLPPQTLLSRLERRLAVLTSGEQDAPVRQQTLRNTLDWSYGLLNQDEQRLFRYLAIFVGGCYLSVFEKLCESLGDLSTPVLDGVASLLDKNLLQVTTSDGEEPRLTMLETVREYGLECLSGSGEMERARQAHASTYCSFVEQADWALLGVEREIWPEWSNREQETWLDWMEREYGNLRAALDFLLDQKEIEAILPFAVGFANVWFFRGYPSDGRRYMERVVAASNTSKITSKARGWALYYSGWLAFYQSDNRRALALLEESKQLFLHLGYTRGVAASLTVLGNIEHHRGNVRTGNEMLEESLLLYRALGDYVGISYALMTQGILVFFRGELTRARSLFEESLVMSKKVGHRWEIASNLHYLGWTHLLQGDYERARQLSEESLALFKEVGHAGYAVETQIVLADEVAALGDEATAQALLEEALTRGREMESQDDIARALCGLGRLALRQNKLDRAQACYEEALAVLKQEARLPDRVQWVLASCLEGIGEIAYAQKQATWAVRLLARAEALRTSDTYRNTIGREQTLFERLLAKVTAQLGEMTFATLWAEGYNMSTEEVLAIRTQDEMRAQDPSPSTLPTTLPPTLPPAGLTRREFEVLRLLAQGLTNVHIAERLVISVTTVNSYLSSIYSKLGVSSRLGAMRYAIDNHLS